VEEKDEADLLAWLSSPANPPVRYVTARDLLDSPVPPQALHELHRAAIAWGPLQEILALQKPDGGFPGREAQQTARATFWALRLMARCGLDVGDEPVARALRFLMANHLHGALSYSRGGSGVLPCYVGVTVATLIRLGALETDLVQWSLRWLVDHQRFDHKSTRAGGGGLWPYRAPANFGCWESVSCYHGVAASFRAFAAVPPPHRSIAIWQRLDEAINYLEIHRLYKKSSSDRPLFRSMTQLSLIADYRSDLLDMLTAVADADPGLISRDWVEEAVTEMDALTTGGKVTLAKNYGKKLIEVVPFEPVGEPSRFLTMEWLRTKRAFAAAA
jgi:hypothetical protein